MGAKGEYFLKSGFQNRSAFTLVEIMVVVVIIGMMAFFFVSGLRYMNKTVELQERLDLSTRVRNASYILSRDLSFAGEVLFPNQESITCESYLIFKNNKNQITGVFLSDDGLMHYNYDLDEARVILPAATNFKCRLPRGGIVEYSVEVESDDFSFTIKNQLTAYNTLP